jgi:hypothetical protein
MPHGHTTARHACIFRILTLSLAAATAAACQPKPHDGPFVLITVDALRADAVGALGGPAGLTPAFDALAAEADLATRAVTPSSWTVPSMASLFSGLQPFRHGVYEGARAALPPALETFPQRFAAAGWHTAAYRSNHWLTRTFGYDRGFADFRSLGQGKRAESALAALDGGRQLVWIHVLPPHAPYVDRERFRDRVPDRPAQLPSRIRPLDLEPYFDPAVQAPAPELAAARALYAMNVAYADEILGRLLAALRASGHWDRTLLVVTSDHGEEFEEDGQILHGGNLHRALVEVPLLVKLPQRFPRQLAARSGQPVGTIHLAATLLDAAGLPPLPGAATSLFAAAPAAVLSELYQGNGSNQFSLVEGDLQLRWVSRFAAPEKDYYRARLSLLGATVEPPLGEPPLALFARLEEAFYQSPPLAGVDAAPGRSLWRWAPDGSVVAAPDEAEVDRLSRDLRQLWRERIGPETRPQPLAAADRPQLSEEEAKKIRALGYVAGGSED